MSEIQVEDHANVKVPAPVLVLLLLIAAFLLRYLGPLPLVAPPIVEYIGFVLIGGCFLLGWNALKEFRRANTSVDPSRPVSNLVTSGIYRFTRNPIYLGFLLLVICIPLTADTYWGVLFAPLFVLLCNRLVIEHEEAYLERKFGTAYTDYKSRVRRWL